MPSYDPTVITFPASETSHLIELLLIHSRPAKEKLLNRERYYCFRDKKSEMHRIYRIVNVLEDVLPALVLEELSKQVFPNKYVLNQDEATRLKNYLNGVENGIRAERIRTYSYHDPQVFYFLTFNADDELPLHTGPAIPSQGQINYTRAQLKIGGKLASKG